MGKKLVVSALLAICLLLMPSCSEIGRGFPAAPGIWYIQDKDTTVEAYKRGKYGDELFWLQSFGTWTERRSFMILRGERGYELVLPQRSGRYKTRKLTREENTDFLSFINGQSVDMLPDRRTGNADGIEYQYLHCTKEKIHSVYINNPEEDSVYGALVGLFEEMAETGQYKPAYWTENTEILINGEDTAVESVWKNGEDFRVCINQGGTLTWHRYQDGTIGEPAAEPEGITLQDAWSDVPIDYITYENIAEYNRYPWQAGSGIYRVRCMSGDRGQGIYLTQKYDDPVFFTEGKYRDPVVIPDSDWVVCAKAAEGGWGLVKINLRTSLEYDLKIKPSDDMYPIAYINQRLLIKSSGGTFEYNIERDSYKRIRMDPFVANGARFLQPAGRPGKYFTVYQTSRGTHAAVYDFNTYTRRPFVFFEDLFFEYDVMWVDIESGEIYIVVNNDLLVFAADVSRSDTENGGEV